jgi:hypothetical protein
MKLNYGWGVTILLSGFIIYILFFLFQALSFDGDLVAEDYYEKELMYQDNIDAQTNFKKLKEEVVVLRLDEYVQIDLPKTTTYEGEIHLYRPSNADLDNKYPIKGEKVYIPNEDLQKGNYQLKISWKSNNKLYYTEKLLTY